MFGNNCKNWKISWNCFIAIIQINSPPFVGDELIIAKERS
nr:MAG TPA: hypothetical protein [Caudoviricetes sp.]